MDYAITFMLAALRTGLVNRNSSIVVPFTNLNRGFLDLLYKEGFINGYVPFKGEKKNIEILLKYHQGKPVISEIICFSTISRKAYIPCSAIWKLDETVQTLILSTSSGMMTGYQARKNNVGGELICIIR